MTIKKIMDFAHAFGNASEDRAVADRFIARDTTLAAERSAA
jgi:hypothetical protein